MQDEILKQAAAGIFTKTLKKCILNYAEKNKTTHEHLFIMLGLGPQGEATYKIMVNSPGYPLGMEVGKKPVFFEQITILDVLGVKKFHILGYDAIAEQYIPPALQKIAAENNIEQSGRVAVLVCTNTVDLVLILCEVDPQGDAGRGEIIRMISRLEDISELF